MIRKTIILGVFVLSLAAVIATIVIQRTQNRAGANSNPAQNTEPAEDPNSLEALEKRLIAAGQTTDPEERDRVTEEITDALIRFHGPQPEEAQPSLTDIEPAQPSAAEPQPEKDYDFAALTADYHEALETKDPDVRRLAIGAVAEFLAANDPEQAKVWMKELLDSSDSGNPDAYHFASIFIETLAKSDLNAAAEWAEVLPAETFRPVAYQYIAGEWTGRDLAAMEAWTVSIEDAALRSTVIRSIGQALVGTDDPEAASQWAQRLAANDADGPRHSDVVVRHWAADDLEAAIRWASNLANSDDIDRSIDGLASAFAKKDPRGAVEWAASFPEGPVKNKVITMTANQWARNEPIAAATWLVHYGRPEVLAGSVPIIFSNWSAKDPAAAERWLSTVPGIEDSFRDYVRTVALGQSQAQSN